jgi:tRNA-binding protein
MSAFWLLVSRFWLLARSRWPVDSELKSFNLRKATVMEKINVAPVKPTISFKEFEKIDIRVGTIEEIENLKGADKLVKLRVNFGDHQRNILAGIKTERVDPGEIIGRQALFVVNLEPREMMGEVSEGMLFDLGYADDITPVLAVPERPVPNGTRAG